MKATLIITIAETKFTAFQNMWDLCKELRKLGHDVFACEEGIWSKTLTVEQIAEVLATA